MEAATCVRPTRLSVESIEESKAMSGWALKQYVDKYAWKDDQGNPTEVWPDTAYRVVRHNLGALGYTDHDAEFQTLKDLVVDRKFMPGGRYLASTGRQIHQTNNCFLYRCGDSREGWADLVSKCILALSSGGGVGSVYSDVRPYGTLIKKTGGFATGPMSPANMVNEVARHVMQGGFRRSAIWGGLHWWHKDIFTWIHSKDWSDEIKASKAKDYSAPAPLDMTNISVILDSEFFLAYENAAHPMHEHAHRVYDETLASMLTTAEPGFSIDTGQNVNECLRNAPVAGDTHVLTKDGYRPVNELVDRSVTVWTGKQWAQDVEFKLTQRDAPIVAVEMTGGRSIRCEPSHEFLVERYKGAGVRRKLNQIDRVAARDLQIGDQLHVAYSSRPDTSRTAIPEALSPKPYTLGWIYGDGSFTATGGADLTLCSDDSKACLPAIEGYSSLNECDSRGYTRMYFGVDDYWKGRSKDRFPVEMFHEKNGRMMMSFVAGLFDAVGNWEPTQRRIRLTSKHEGFLRDVARALEQVGVMAHVTKAGFSTEFSTYGQAQGYQLVVAASYLKAFAARIPTRRVRPDLEGYEPCRTSAIKVVAVTDDGFEDVYCADVQVEDHSFMAEGVIISNCTEITSEDDSDVCNLGSLNMARFTDIEDFSNAVRHATLFLLAGTVYSDVPHAKVKEVREKNRRIGLGLMGVHEWLLIRGYRYEVVPELHEWLAVYRDVSDAAAIEWAGKHNLSVPVKKRALAPNGTIAIVAETTTSGEPIFCVAEKRRFLDTDGKWKYQYVINPTAARLIEHYGIDPDTIEDAYMLSYDYERRIKFQFDIQAYVDHGISSTINLPGPITDPAEVKAFGDTLMKYAPGLRGVTCYPDGCRSGQPLTAVPYHIAKGKVGVTYEDDHETCVGGVCGL